MYFISSIAFIFDKRILQRSPDLFVSERILRLFVAGRGACKRVAARVIADVFTLEISPNG